MHLERDGKKRTDRLTVLQFGLSTFTVLVLWTVSAGAALTAILVTLGTGGSFSKALTTYVTAVTLFFIGLLVLPSAIFSFLRILGKESRGRTGSMNSLYPALIGATYLLVVFLGYFAANQNNFIGLFLGPLHVIAMGLPVLFFIFISIRGLPVGTLQRVWGTLGSGLILSPTLIAILEIATLLVISAAVIMFAPSVMKDFSSLLGQEYPLTQEAITKALMPLLKSPWVIGAIFLFASVSIPLIEELFKPLAVWMLAGRKISATAGFTAGVISGAGYALAENLMLFPGTHNWYIVVLMRAGTVAIHTFTAGIVGWAIIKAVRERKFGLLGLVYLGAVFIHGSWNGLTLLSTAGALSQEFNLFAVNNNMINWLSGFAGFGLIMIAFGAFIGLVLINRKLVSLQQKPEQRPEQHSG